MTTLAQARKNLTNNGCTAAIRAALTRVGKPLSKYKLHLATGYDVDQVGRAVRDMLHRGGLVRVNGANGIFYYDLYRREKAKPALSGSGQIAGPITIPQYNWLGTRLG